LLVNWLLCFYTFTEKTCLTWSHNLATSTALRSDEEKSDEGGNSTKTYIKDNPELEKILKDLYDDQDREKLVGAMQTKFNVFKDDDSPVIYDVDEEREIMLEKQLLQEEEVKRAGETEKHSPNQYYKYGLAHGSTGVFDVDGLVDVLVGENCQDVAVISIAEDLGYVDHMVIVTCKSKRHLRSAATLVRKMYKLRRQKLAGTKKLRSDDKVPRIEGIGDPDSEWLAVDLGNIALHFFLHETRQVYDLESLWGVGPDLAKEEASEDAHLASSKELEALIQQSSSLLADLEPAKSDSKSP